MSERLPIQQPEIPQTKEILLPRFGGITISGPSGTGKTAVMKVLTNDYSIASDRSLKTGEKMRQITGAGQASRGFMQRDRKVDREIDQWQEDIIKSADIHNPFILEGRLAGFIVSQIPDTNVVSILLTAPNRERMKRILKRAKEDSFRKIADLEYDQYKALSQDEEPEKVGDISIRLLAEQAEYKSLNLKKIKRLEKEREDADLKRWQEEHPELRGIYPFNPGNKTPDRRPIYNIVISTNGLSVKQVAEKVSEELKKMGKLVSSEDFGKGKAGQMAFAAVLNEVPCTTYVDESKNECGNIPIGTVDADIGASFDVFPYCTEEHALILEKELRAATHSSLGRNGRGRA